jgi:hypothetical protein
VAEAFVELLEKVKIKRKNRTFKVLARDRRVLSALTPLAPIGCHQIRTVQTHVLAREMAAGTGFNKFAYSVITTPPRAGFGSVSLSTCGRAEGSRAPRRHLLRPHLIAHSVLAASESSAMAEFARFNHQIIKSLFAQGEVSFPWPVGSAEITIRWKIMLAVIGLSRRDLTGAAASRTRSRHPIH